MAQTSFFADTLSVAYIIAGGATLDVGVMKGVEIKAEWEHVELYGQDSLFREDVQRKNAKVTLKASTAKFHPNIIGKILGTETADKDIDGNAEVGTTHATMTDSNTVPLFQLTGTVTGKNSEPFVARITNVYFEDAPFNLPDGEFMVTELNGVGDKMEAAYKTV